MHIVKNVDFYEEWKEKVRQYLEKNVEHNPDVRPTDYFVNLSESVETLMNQRLYEELDQFGGIAAASLGAALTLDEYEFIENNLGPITPASVGYYVLFSLAEETAENLAFKTPAIPFDNEHTHEELLIQIIN